LQAHEEKFVELSRQVQAQRESEQKALQEKINALQRMLDNESNRETINYYESESSSLMKAQKRLFDVERELSDKMRKRREIEAKLKHIEKQMEQQAECNQGQFRDMMQRLQRQGMDVDRQIECIRKMLQNEAEEYLKRLK
jgi:recombinational DNA repair ATPase RecF